MDTALANIKKLTIIKVISLIASGMKQKDACEVVNISVDTFSRYIQDNPSIVPTFIREKEIELYSLYEPIADTLKDITQELISRAQEPDLETKELLAIQSRLQSIANNMKSQLSIISNMEEKEEKQDSNTKAAQAFLESLSQGPHQKRKSNKATITRTESLVIDLGDEDEPDIIEGETIEEPPQ